MSGSLQHKYRPETFDDLAGNEEVVKALKMLFERKKESLPHAFLFTGPAGCGKTTLARIIKNELGCSDEDFKEYNAANTRGIEFIREITSNVWFSAMNGKVKVYLLDECFAKGTPITTDRGVLPIEQIAAGDRVFCRDGLGTVQKTFVNKVPLERVVRVDLSNGKFLVCSDSHVFFTENGEQPAKNMSSGEMLFDFSSKPLSNTGKLKEFKYETKARGTNLRGVRSFVLGGKNKFPILHETMFRSVAKETQSEPQSSLSGMRDGVSQSYSRACVLRKKLFGKKQIEASRNSRSFVLRQYPGENKQSFANFSTVGRGESKQRAVIKTNERKQPLFQSTNCGKDGNNQTNKRNSKCVGWNSRRERPVNRMSDSVGGSSRLAYGSCRADESRRTSFIRVPSSLQSGCGKSEVENSYRGGRERALVQNEKGTRPEKRIQTERTRVVSVTFYKRGHNDQLFSGSISDKEKNQGFIELYDFEMDKHPSYYANGVLVHNCHQLTKDAQESLLKTLEDTPKHVFFVLCTTDPEQLKKSFKSRCHTYQVDAIPTRKMVPYLKTILAKEGVKDFPQEILHEISQTSEGCVRDAVKMLDAVIGMDDEEEMSKVIQSSASIEDRVKELIQLILSKQGKKWKQASSILKSMEEDPEKVRRAILGYMSAVLMNTEDDRIAEIMGLFMDPFYNTGKPGLVYNVYLACKV